MRKFVDSIICAAVAFSCSFLVFANSGPVFWQGYPSSEVMSIVKDSPITVESENLTFDFSGNERSDFTISGNVTAAYEMVNPTNETQSVQMAFPFVEALDRLSPEDIAITADNSTLPYVIYTGAVVESNGSPLVEDKEVSFDFAGIISNITDEPYKAENFTENEKGKLYIINVKPITDQRINLAVDFNFDYKKTKILTNGFNRYERSEEKTKIAAWCYEPERLEIYVLGEDIDLKINGYTDGELSEKTDLFTCEISAQEVEVKAYLMNYIGKKNDVKNNSAISDTQLYNLYAEALDKYLTLNLGYSSEDDLMAQQNYERIMTLVYTVEFPPDSKKLVSVRYNTAGTMDMRETAKPMYSYDYILNPAENWRDFKDLNIKIISPKEAPYIVKSSIDFKGEGSNVYTASLEELPEEDLFFTLYEAERITLVDKAVGNLHHSFGYLYPLIIGGAVVLVIVGVIAVISIFRRRR